MVIEVHVQVLDNVCKTYIFPCLTKVNEVENVGHRLTIMLF